MTLENKHCVPYCDLIKILQHNIVSKTTCPPGLEIQKSNQPKNIETSVSGIDWCITLLLYTFRALSSQVVDFDNGHFGWLEASRVPPAKV